MVGGALNDAIISKKQSNLLTNSVQIAKGFLGKTTALHAQHIIFCTTVLAITHDYDVKFPYAAFHGEACF